MTAPCCAIVYVVESNMMTQTAKIRFCIGCFPDVLTVDVVRVLPAQTRRSRRVRGRSPQSCAPADEAGGARSVSFRTLSSAGCCCNSDCHSRSHSQRHRTTADPKIRTTAGTTRMRSYRHKADTSHSHSESRSHTYMAGSFRRTRNTRVGRPGGHAADERPRRSLQ
jgi:hypothetical protein